MGALESLRAQLKHTNDQAFRGLVLDQKPMAQEVRRLQEWLGSVGSTKPTRNHMLDALRRFYQSKALANLRDTRLVCHACIEVFGDKAYQLIADSERFALLLNAVHQYRERPRLLRRCYRALLHAYFVFDREAEDVSPEGTKNWMELRTHLRGWVDRLVEESAVPEWVSCISEHRSLLGDDPCARYGLAMLEGHREEFEQVQRALAIPGASWLVRQLILAQVDAAARLNDADFRSHIVALLALLAEHQVVLRQGLANILERYRGCATVSINAELRDFAVKHFGNPWLTRNSAPWGLVSGETKAMVTDWLKLELIHQFFSLLAEDGASDTRRLRFWQRYRAHIDDMYFALGSSAGSNRSVDFRAIREKMRGRLLHLFAAGSPENNAFIMCIGEHVVVEFGRYGNACFIFHRDNLPFDLSSRDIAGNKEQLKHDSNLERLLHIDRQDGNWEEQFEAILARRLRVRPSDRDTLGPTYAAGPRSSNQPAATSGRQSAPAATSGPSRAAPTPGKYPTGTAAGPFSRREFDRFCAARRLRVVDHTGQGGNLRVATDYRDEAVNRQLEAWGFQYKEGRGWWRKEG